jgi:hypothetical protein
MKASAQGLLDQLIAAQRAEPEDIFDYEDAMNDGVSVNQARGQASPGRRCP